MHAAQFLLNAYSVTSKSPSIKKDIGIYEDIQSQLVIAMIDNLAIVKSVYANFARGDLRTAFGAFDPQIVWNEASGYPSVGGRHIGVPAVIEVLTRVVTEWPNITIMPAEFFVDGDRVVVLGETSGSHATTGKSFRSPFAHAWTIRKGRIIEWRAYIDTALVREAAALIE